MLQQIFYLCAVLKRRNTPAKNTVLTILKDAESALSQDMIEEMVKGEIDRVTIYRILNSFCEDGVTHRIVAEDGKNYYALCTECSDKSHNHDHFHFSCLSCGKVECLKEPIAFKLPRGYKLEGINCVISGVCAKCSKKS